MNKNKIPDTFYIYEMSYYDFNSSERYRTKRKKYKVVDKKSFTPYYLLMKKVTAIRWTMITLVFVAAIMICLMSIMPLMKGTGMDKRTGTVINGQIKYVQNVVKYVDLEDVGIDPSEVSDGDKINLYFDHDNIVSVGTNTRDEISDIKGVISMLSAILICPIAIGFIIMWMGRFSINDFGNGVYGYRKEGNSIMLRPLCVPCRKDGSLMESRMEQKRLLKILKRKKYHMGITRAEAVILTPSSGESKKTKIWILNNEAYYDEILALE